MKPPRLAVIDFETHAIARRPAYPPVPVGVSIQLPEERAPRYYAWGHPAGNNCTKAQAAKALCEAVQAKDGILCHNAKFDYEVLIAHFGLAYELPWGKIHDTLYLIYLTDPHALSLSLKPSAQRILGMAPEESDAVRNWLVEHRVCRNTAEWGAFISQAPGALVGRYAIGDVVRTKRLFAKLYPQIVRDKMLAAYDRERQLMPILLRNEQEGVRVDTQLMETWAAEYATAFERAEAWLRKTLKAPGLNIDSGAALAEALERAGMVSDWALTPTGQRSTAKDALPPAKFKDWRVAAVLGYRNRLATCLSTFITPWREMSHATGRIHTSWNQVRNSDSGKGTRTGRLSTNPNFQNIPKAWSDKGDGYRHPSFLRGLSELPLLRKLILPEKGEVLLRRDYNQQELRILAHYEDDRLLERYQADPKLDVHTFVQTEIQRLTGHAFERRAVKVLNFGMLYGMGLDRLAESVGCTVDDARLLREGQRKAIPGLFALDRALKQDDFIRTWGGRVYRKEPPMIVNGRTMDFGYKLLNYLIQGSAADCTKQALIAYDGVREHGSLRLCVHDEIDISVPKSRLKAESKLLDAAMRTPRFDCPLLTDAEAGVNWSSMEKTK